MLIYLNILMKKTYAFYLDKEVINYLKKIAKKEERSQSEVLNRILKRALKGGQKKK